MREVIAPEAVARLQPVCKNGAAGEGIYCTRPGLSKTSEQETHMPYQECTSVEVRLQSHIALSVLSCVEGGYSDGQIPRITGATPEEVVALREACRRGGYA